MQNTRETVFRLEVEVRLEAAIPSASVDTVDSKLEKTWVQGLGQVAAQPT